MRVQCNHKNKKKKKQQWTKTYKKQPLQCTAMCMLWKQWQTIPHWHTAYARSYYPDTEWKKTHRMLSRFSNVLCDILSLPLLLSCSCNGLNVHGIDNDKQTESNVLEMEVTSMLALKASKKTSPPHAYRLSDGKWFHICSFHRMVSFTFI